jgi:hypothetical protein
VGGRGVWRVRSRRTCALVLLYRIVCLGMSVGEEKEGGEGMGI